MTERAYESLEKTDAVKVSQREPSDDLRLLTDSYLCTWKNLNRKEAKSNKSLLKSEMQGRAKQAVRARLGTALQMTIYSERRREAEISLR